MFDRDEAFQALRRATHAGGVALSPNPRQRVGVRGNFYGRMLDRHGRVEQDWFRLKNAATTQGLNYLLETGFRGGTAVTTWYAGLINGSGFSAVAAGDTMASHAGWTEYQGYTESVRQTWSPGAAASGTIINGTVMTFTNGGSSATIQGVFISALSTKGGTTLTLWSTAVESSPRSLSASGTFQVFYELDLTPQS